MKILGICGSIRSGSSNEKILKLIALHWREEFEMEIYSGLGELPHFNPDTTEEHIPVNVRLLRDKIQTADGVIICTPEYVFSPPGALKNALEWMVSVMIMSDKPLALIIASGLGEKTLESLTLILDTLGVKWNEHCRLLIPDARGKMDAQGSFSDDETFQKVQKLVTALRDVITGRQIG